LHGLRALLALHRLVSLYRLLAIALYVATFTILPDNRLPVW
jgi:hypothetical protein